MAEVERDLNYVCDFYLNIADQLLARPEGVVANELGDRDLFTLLSDFYLNPGENEKAGKVGSSEGKQELENLDFIMI